MAGSRADAKFDAALSAAGWEAKYGSPAAPEHGAERNRRTVTTSDAPTPCVTTAPGDKEVFLLPGPSYTRQRFERFCRPCGDWIEAEGIIGAMMCPQCKGAW